jgi:hypothetical protein
MSNTFARKKSQEGTGTGNLPATMATADLSEGVTLASIGEVVKEVVREVVKEELSPVKEELSSVKGANLSSVKADLERLNMRTEILVEYQMGQKACNMASQMFGTDSFATVSLSFRFMKS